MPYKSEKMAINNPKLDKRVKLTDEDKSNIRKEYEEGTISINALSRKYNVNKRSIQFILFPERLEKAKKDYAERRKDGRYYDKDKHNVSTNMHRKYKQELYKEGLLDEKPTE